MKKSSGTVHAIEVPIGEFCVGETHGIAYRNGNRVRLSSQGRGWMSMYASVQHETPHVARFAACPHHLLVLHLDVGTLFVLPSGTSGELRVDHPTDSIHFYIHERILREVADTLGYPAVEPGTVAARFGVRDPFLQRLGMAVLDLLESVDCSTAVQADFVSRAAAAHLLAKHCSRAIPPAPIGSRPQKGSLTQVLRYMQANFSKRLSIAELARIAALSEQQFSRKFKQVTGVTPHHYLLTLRVERAKRMLQQDPPIAEVAFECGFAHQEHLTNVFRRFTSLTPASYRREARLRTPEQNDTQLAIHPLTQTRREMQ